MEVLDIKNLVEIIELYKKRGGYILWMLDGKIDIAFPKKPLPDHSLFRTLISGELVKSSLIDWKKLEADKKYLLHANQNITKLKSNWEIFTKTG